MLIKMTSLAQLALIVGVVKVSSYSRGGIGSSCNSMTPTHNPSVAQTTPAPYALTVSTSTYGGGEQITVTLSNSTAVAFTGFLIQARTNVDNYTTYGSFDTPAGTHNPCDQAAVSQNTGSTKTAVVFTWTAPPAGVGNITFVYTVVQTKRIFWVKVASVPITFDGTTQTPGLNSSSVAITTSTTTQSPSSSSIPTATTTQTPGQSPSTVAITTPTTTQAPGSTGDSSISTATTTQSPGQSPSTVAITTSTTTQAPDSTGDSTITKDSGCGSTVGCFSDCSSGSCGFILTWKDVNDSIDFTLSCRASGNAYCSIGLSNDDKMGDDSVFDCISTDGSVTVQLSYNDGKTNSPLDNKALGLTVDSTSHEEGIISCTFSRKKTFDIAVAMTTGRKKRAAPSSSTYFDMNNDYTLIFATGPAIAGTTMIHIAVPLLSSMKADFQSVTDLLAIEPSRILIKFHGMSMAISWMLLSTVGIFMARFYKPLWGENGQEWCGLKRWFMVHRTCMVLVFVLTLLSFTIIFIHVEGYSEIFGDNFEKSHPSIGIGVMVLTIINPLMSLMRPAPGTSKRQVFNIGHSVVGYSAQICATVNLFSGTMLTSSNMDEDAHYVLYVFVVLVLVIFIICEIYDRMENQCEDLTVPSVVINGQPYELKRRAVDEKETNSKPSHKLKMFLLFFNLLVLFALTVAMVTMILMA